MKLLVLGGTRFLGRHLVDAAIGAGHDVTIFTRGLLKHLITRMYFPNESANDDDPVLARVRKDRRATLIAAPIDGRGGSLRWDVVLQGKNETVFFDY